jgi:trimeric autotransporter adhesin
MKTQTTLFTLIAAPADVSLAPPDEGLSRIWQVKPQGERKTVMKHRVELIKTIASLKNSPHRLVCWRGFLPIPLALVLACFALSPRAQGVIPAPDGGYPGANTAEGQNALLSLASGTNNTAVGWSSLKTLTTGQYNTAIGSGALSVNTTDFNTATGAAALWRNTSGAGNTANGFAALFSNTSGNINTAVGFEALLSNTEGDYNTAGGYLALYSNTTGGGNTAYGFSALPNNSTGDHNTAVGINAGNLVFTANNVIAIGTPGGNVSDSCYIGNIWNRPGGSQAVYVNADGKLGAQVSSLRFKDQIKPLGEASEVIYGLRPVSFRYKPEIEPTRPLSFGLIAEEVGKMNPDLVVRDNEGKPFTVRYEQINAMLLNEFLKEHRKVEQQQTRITQLTSTVAKQERKIDALTAGLQKVSAQIAVRSPSHGGLAVSKTVSRVVVNNP